MNIERLRKILDYSKNKRNETNSMVRFFCSNSGIDSDIDVLNIMQIVRSSFIMRGYLVFEMPFADDEIGAFCYRGEGLGYVVINTSLPKVNANFAVAHEIFHVFFQDSTTVYKVEFSDENDYEHEEEYLANLFAGVLLMPEISFRKMYAKFKRDSNSNVLHTLIRLMAYYEVPYMSVLIRCLELDLLERNTNYDELIDVNREEVRSILNELWLDDSIMKATNKDDYSRIEECVREYGRKYIEEKYLNERDLEVAISNMKKFHKSLLGG